MARSRQRLKKALPVKRREFYGGLGFDARFPGLLLGTFWPKFLGDRREAMV